LRHSGIEVVIQFWMSRRPGRVEARRYRHLAARHRRDPDRPGLHRRQEGDDRGGRGLAGAGQRDADIGVLRLARAVDDAAHHGELVAACPGCGRTTSTVFQELARDIQNWITTSMPDASTRPGR
jgi:hypothetical protein